MRGIGLMVMLTATLGVLVGCQHDVALRTLDARPETPSSLFDAQSVAIQSSVRQVTLEFSKPPLDEIDSDTLFIYLSVPLHSAEGMQFDDTRIGVGWLDVTLLFSGVYRLYPAKQTRRAGGDHDWPSSADATAPPFAYTRGTGEYNEDPAMLEELIYRNGWQKLEAAAQFKKDDGTSVLVPMPSEFEASSGTPVPEPPKP